MGKRYINKDDELILQSSMALVATGLFSCHTPEQVEAAVGFARFLRRVGINRRNYPFFLKMLETNNRYVIDALLSNKEPKLTFSAIKPNAYLIQKSFLILSFWHPGQIYHKLLQALLGIIEYSYYLPDDGFKIYKLKINDLNNIGKYLDEEQPHDEPDNRLLLDVLDKITRLGLYEESIEKSILAKHAFDIRIAYFDNTKSLCNIIPQLLLTKVAGNDYEIKPAKRYLLYLENLAKEKPDDTVS